MIESKRESLPVTVLSALLLTGCAGSPSPGVMAVEGCVLGPVAASSPAAASREAGTLLVALPNRVDPARAPVPGNESERLVFAQIYETLVHLDCAGTPRPGGAESWEASSGGRVWTFRLREELRSWRGEPVSARDVAASWIEAQAGWGGRPDLDSPALRTLATVSAPEARTLRVELATPVGVEFFAQAEFSLRSGRDLAGWPVGTGPFRPRSGPPPAGGAPLGRLTLDRTGGGTGLGLDFLVFDGDPRDALDAGAEILVTADPATVAYAGDHPRLRNVPLPWDRVYALLAPSAPPPDAAVGGTAPPTALPRLVRPPAGELEALAAEAVRQDARGAPVPEGDRCEPGSASISPLRPIRRPAGPPRIAFRASDPVARSLAERIVALSSVPAGTGTPWLIDILPVSFPGSPPLRAAGLSDGAFADALRGGEETAYIVGVDGSLRDPREPLALPGSCVALLRIAASAPWVGTLPDDPSNGRPAVAFLVETRPTLLIARDVAGAELAPGGIVRLERARRVEGR